MSGGMAQSKFVRGIYIDSEVEKRAKALAKAKGTSINQVFREAVLKLYRLELGNTRPEEILEG
ncbi:hypothetical protein TK0612 [Thermococcus kodakarensis KOD1]|uniref:Uncharacterized protein n=2 Tax=Thermococcus TaxID=2263 RepID=Q5JCZ8_THEKO|nr:hypothetical protein TK0383 [Thermococcus kodakarensis KOD1]BAD84801.1 hypothetical protein TK0612 [Thermococcus kodakarensis KOD1]